jgi:aminopeptidase N
MMQKTEYLKDYQAPEFYVDTVDLIFELAEEFTIVKAQLFIRANDPSKNAPLVLDGKDLELISVSLNGQQLTKNDYELTAQHLTIPNVGAACQIDTVVKIKPQENTMLMGLYQSSGNFCTQCEAEGFRRITYYIDRPDNLAIFTVTIVADKDKYPILLSNGNNVDSGIALGNKHWIKWHDPHKKAAHLFALVAGDFDVLDDQFVTMSARKVKLRLFVERGNLDKTNHAMQALKQSMRWDEEVYGREYDLDIFMTVAVSDFNMGAMENKGLNIFNTKFILANQQTATDTDFINITRVVGHEYFHNWSGNRVGCRDWFQLSLKEGFTVFRDQNFTGDMSSFAVKRIEDVNLLRSLQFKEDSSPMAHPIRPASYMEINNFYTLTVYEKGAEVIRMLYTLLGSKKFREATDLYFSRFDGQAVTTDDFVDCMQKVSGIDLGQFRRWYSQSGTPLLTITDEYDAKQQRYLLHVKQETKSTADQKTKRALHIPLRMGLLDQAGAELTTQLLHITKAEQTFEFINIPHKPTPSLLRGFSAPVNLRYDYTTAQLQLLLKHDRDEFARWEAGQVLALRNLQTSQLDPQFIDIFKHLLQAKDIDSAFLALLLTLPSETYLADQMAEIDPLAIHQTREGARLNLAKSLQSEFLQCYKNNLQTGVYDLSNNAVGQRALKNVCLDYLMLLDDQAITQLALQQYQTANNMTDKYTALVSLAHSENCESNTVLDDFYKYYQQDPLVIDKWFAVQATAKSSSTFANVKRLMQHPDFNIKNPNRARALIANFVKNNPGQFHAQEGAAYQWLGDIVLELNKLNPQLASRLVEPLTHWRRFAEPYKTRMQEQLRRIAAAELSLDVYEVVTKALN